MPMNSWKIYFFQLPIIVFLTAILACQTNNASKSGEDHVPSPSKQMTVDTLAWETYQNSTYNLSLQYPSDWQVVESPQSTEGNFAVSLYPAGEEAGLDVPLGLHEKADLPYLVIYPMGLGTEFPSGSSSSFLSEGIDPIDVKFVPGQSTSLVFRLFNGEIWGYFLRPETPPANWSDEGFIFAQYAVENFEAQCFDKNTGEEKALDDCDPLAGDRYVRKGQVVPHFANVVHTMLKTMELGDFDNPEPISELIRVFNPLPNLDITSPYVIKGKAVGPWFHEGSFPIFLYDADKQLLTQVNAEAQGNWMTEEFVPFEATLEFDAPNDELGQLVFVRANPSAKPENDRKYSVPVVLPPAE